MASARGGVPAASASTQSGTESSNAELFVLAVSVLSIFNIVLLILPLDSEINAVVTIVDLFLSVVLLTDFAFRFHRGGKRYFFKERGWLDFIGSLMVPGLRLFRLVRMTKAANALKRKGLRQLGRDVRANLAEGALFIIAFLVIIVLEFGAMAVVVAERGAPNANIVTGGDALWWGVVSMTTVGYGDEYPVTRWGRLVGIIVMVTGVALLGILTGYLANAFLNPSRRRMATQADHGVQATQADHGVQATQADHGVQATQADHGVQATQARPGSHAATLAEVGRLLDEQEAALATLRERIAELEPDRPSPD